MTEPSPLRRAPRPPRERREKWAVASSALATLGAWAVFAHLPPMPVRVGAAIMETTVPLGYQLSVFPAFGALLGALAFDVARWRAGTARVAWWPRALLVAVTGALAAARIAGALPLSGHTIFLFAAVAYELGRPSESDAVVLTTAIPALLVVGWCKLVVWGDPLWFVASAVLGAGIGACVRMCASKSHHPLG